MPPDGVEPPAAKDAKLRHRLTRIDQAQELPDFLPAGDEARVDALPGGQHLGGKEKPIRGNLSADDGSRWELVGSWLSARAMARAVAATISEP